MSNIRPFENNPSIKCAARLAQAPHGVGDHAQPLGLWRTCEGRSGRVVAEELILLFCFLVRAVLEVMGKKEVEKPPLINEYGFTQQLFFIPIQQSACRVIYHCITVALYKQRNTTGPACVFFFS